MKKKNKENEVLKELRKIRQKHYEETKNMTFEEEREYYHRGSEALREEMARMSYEDGRKDFPFLFHDSGKEEKNAPQKSGNSVLRELRKIRNKNYEATKNMTSEERREYYHRGAENFDRKFSRVGKEATNEN
jgi:shikimate kinase